MKFFKSNFAKKLIIVLIVLMIFNLAIPRRVKAWDVGGVLLKPFTAIGLVVLVSIDVGLGLIIGVTNIVTSNYGALVEKLTDKGEMSSVNYEGENNSVIVDGKSYIMNEIFIGPDTIFSGQVELLDANIFEADVSTGFSPSGLGGTLKKGIAATYVTLRNICAMLMLAGLIFTGIRVLVTSNTPNKAAQWRQLVFDWLVGMALLIFSHVIMYGIFYISDLITGFLKDTLVRVWVDKF